MWCQGVPYNLPVPFYFTVSTVNNANFDLNFFNAATCYECISPAWMKGNLTTSYGYVWLEAINHNAIFHAHLAFQFTVGYSALTTPPPVIPPAVAADEPGACPSCTVSINGVCYGCSNGGGCPSFQGAACYCGGASCVNLASSCCHREQPEEEDHDGDNDCEDCTREQ